MNERVHPDRRHPAHHPPIERFNEPVILLTTVCAQNRQPVLACEAVHRICREVWKAADFWRVGRYVIMPDHIHLFCAPGRIPMPSMRQWVEFWKSQIARHFPSILGGPTSVSAVSVSNPDGTEPVPPEGRETHKLWQRDYWDTQMRSRAHYDEKWVYVRINPVRQGLAGTPDEWPFQGEVFPLAWC
ncbi:MAG: hypothetical protein EOL90_11050 [Spartobacteria bacterium]|nr:hypothetical protein [Spartobacteria bacterium]